MARPKFCQQSPSFVNACYIEGTRTWEKSLDYESLPLGQIRYIFDGTDSASGQSFTPSSKTARREVTSRIAPRLGRAPTNRL